MRTEPGDVASLFRDQPGYLRLLSVRACSQFGDGAFNVGLAGLFFFNPQQASTPAGVAWALTAGLLPYTLVGPFAGVLLDRWFRRQVILTANILRVGLVLVATALVSAGAPTWSLLLVALVCLGVDRFVLAGVQAALPHVVQRRLLVLANSLTPTLGTLCMLIGMGGGFVLVQALGAGQRAGAGALLLGAAGYVGAVLTTLTLGRRALGPDRPGGAVPVLGAFAGTARGMWAGARHIAAAEPRWWCFAVIVTTRLGFGSFTVMTILVARNSFTDDTRAGLDLVALVVALAGAGTASASVLTPLALRVLPARGWVLLCLLTVAAVYLGWATALDRGLLLALAAPLGLALQGTKIVLDTTLQLTTEEPFWGRVFSLADMTYNAAIITAAVIAAAVVPPSGYSPGLLLALVLAHLVLAGWTLTRRAAPVQPLGELPPGQRSRR